MAEIPAEVDPQLLGYVSKLRTKFQSLDRVDQLAPSLNGHVPPPETSKNRPVLKLYPRTGIVCIGDNKYIDVGIPNIFVLNYLGLHSGLPVPEDRINRLARRFGSKSENPGLDMDCLLREHGEPNIITRKYDGVEHVFRIKARMQVMQNTQSILRVDPRAPKKAVEMSDQHRAEFTSAVETCYQPILGYLYRLCGGKRQLAEDLTQVCFERAFGAFEGFKQKDGGGKVEPWLYRIATNACLDEMRRRRVIRMCSMGEIPPATLDIFLSQYEDLRSSEDEAVRAENDRSFNKAIQKLPPKYELALRLQMNGLSGEEIAKDIGTTPGAAKIVLFRARERLKSKILEIDPEIVHHIR